jgi:signal transduction histidine kinase
MRHPSEKEYNGYEMPKHAEPGTDIAHWLLQPRTKRGLRSPHIWIILALFAVFTYIYYGVMTSYHDVYVVIFFYPFIYAAFVYRLRGVFISGLVFLAIILPRALLLNYEAISLLRTLLYALFVFLVSGLVATLLNYLERQIESNREILALNNEMNEYVERLQTTQRQLIQAAKLSSIGELSAGVAHELNNPLSGVLIYTRLMKEKLAKNSIDKQQLLNNLDKIESAIDYTSGIVRGLLDFARQSEPLLRPVTVGRAIEKALSLVEHEPSFKLIEVVREESPELPLVVADFNQLVQVFINLLVNAIQAMREGGRLTVRTGTGNGWVKMSVSDTGAGITPENMERLFTPFFTTKEDLKGVGLGLAVSHGIIERHGGRIEAHSEVGKGSTFTVFLPAFREDGLVSSTG